VTLTERNRVRCTDAEQWTSLGYSSRRKAVYWHGLGVTFVGSQIGCLSENDLGALLPVARAVNARKSGHFRGFRKPSCLCTQMFLIT